MNSPPSDNKASPPLQPPAGRLRPWSAANVKASLLASPHRVGFLFATILLIVASAWWLLVQLSRAGGLPSVNAVLPTTTVHAAIMTFGFFPLFFAGFLFTAGPKWLAMPPVDARTLLPALLLQATGWLLWLTGAYLSAPLAIAGTVLAFTGLLHTYWRFAKLLMGSRSADKVHAMIIFTAGVVGCISLGGLSISLLLQAYDTAHAWLHTGLWGFLGVTYVTVIHRMLPFFTSAALPMIAVWRPFWVLGFLLSAVLVKLLDTWITWAGWDQTAWILFQSLWMLVSGWVVLWLALIWGLVQSLKIRLLAMLHVGFVWLGLGFLLSAMSDYWTLVSQASPLGIGALHAMTMGFMGSMMMAMVTRVTCGHSGRTLVADNMVWYLFWVLQAATGLRIAATWPDLGLTATHLTALAAFCWLVCMLPWGLRHIGWYLRPRRDGRPG